MRFLEGKRISIGNENAFKSIGYVKDYYIDRRFSPKLESKNGEPKAVGEDNVNGFQQKYIILANDPGEGKSTVLTSVVRRTAEIDKKEKSDNVWIVRINLNEYAIDKQNSHSLHNVIERDNKRSIQKIERPTFI